MTQLGAKVKRCGVELNSTEIDRQPPKTKKGDPKTAFHEFA